MKTLQSTLLLALLSSSLLHPALVQADEAAPDQHVANIFTTLSQSEIPSSMTGKDLTADWRVLRVTNAAEQTALLRAMSGMERGDAAPWNDVFYTRGDLVSIADQNYLVAYRILPPSDLKERRRQQQYLEAWQKENNEDDEYAFSTALPPVDENSQLALSLIAIGKNTNLNDIRTFDPAKDLMTAKYKSSRKTIIERATSQTNLKNVALALKQYIQDYDDFYPAMRAARNAKDFTGNQNRESPTAPFQVKLMPYVRSSEIFLHPGTGRPYLPNYKVSQLGEFMIENPTETFLVFEDAPDAEGMRSVAFVDGHVKAFKEAEFQILRKAQGISESGLPSALPPGFKQKKTGSNPSGAAAPGRAPVPGRPPR